jgi:threonine/homoserine/homoserine lactone efflux protein
MPAMELTQTHHLWLYFVLVAGIIVLPGMDMAYVLASSLVDGRRAGAAAVSGVVAGGFVHVAMAGLGIGLVLVSVPRLFNLMLVAGAAYVAWMGWQLMRHASAFGGLRETASRPLHRTFARAMATCLLNPKAYVFTLAVFPQFLRAEYGSIVLQCVLLSLITAATQVAVYGAVALSADRMRNWLHTHGTAQIALGRAVGLLLWATAAWAAWEGWRHVH